jgi:hypothetical protein
MRRPKPFLTTLTWLVSTRRLITAKVKSATTGQAFLARVLLRKRNTRPTEDHLLASYKGRIQPNGVLAGEANLFTAQEAVEWLVRLYDEWGKPEEGPKWRDKLGAVKAVTNQTR